MHELFNANYLKYAPCWVMHSKCKRDSVRNVCEKSPVCQWKKIRIFVDLIFILENWLEAFVCFGEIFVGRILSPKFSVHTVCFSGMNLQMGPCACIWQPHCICTWKCTYRCVSGRMRRMCKKQKCYMHINCKLLIFSLKRALFLGEYMPTCIMKMMATRICVIKVASLIKLCKLYVYTP